MKTLASIAFTSLLVSVGCTDPAADDTMGDDAVADDGSTDDSSDDSTTDDSSTDDGTPIDPTRPATCADIASTNPTAPDGDYVLFHGDRELNVYCADMRSEPTSYLDLHENGTWSTFMAGGAAVGTTVRTDFDKVRIDPIKLELAINDHTFSVSDGSVTLPLSGTVTEMPLGHAMTCGGGYATAQVDLQGTPFEILTTFAVSGEASATGHAELWESKQTVEMWTNGDCGIVGPVMAPAGSPAATSELAIKLVFKP